MIKMKQDDKIILIVFVIILLLSNLCFYRLILRDIKDLKNAIFSESNIIDLQCINPIVLDEQYCPNTNIIKGK